MLPKMHTSARVGGTLVTSLSVTVGTIVIIFETIVSTGTVGSDDTVLSVPVGTTVGNVGVPGISLLRFPEPAFDGVFPIHPLAKKSRRVIEITKTGIVYLTKSQSSGWECRGFNITVC